MIRYGFDLKDHVEMWKDFADSISGFGFHIANARLFVLSEMISSRVNAGYFGEQEFYPQMDHIILLISYAKEATANAKVIYLFTISDWLNKIINAIDERERHAEIEREYHRKRLVDETNEIANQAHLPPDDMGTIPF